MPGQVLCRRTRLAWGLAKKVVSKPLPTLLPPTREVFPGPPGAGVSPQLSSQQGRACWAGHVPAPSTMWGLPDTVLCLPPAAWHLGARRRQSRVNAGMASMQMEGRVRPTRFTAPRERVPTRPGTGHPSSLML